jgi:serine/threonine protein phosphatase PrpC
VTLVLNVAVRTDRGLVRANNEDAVYAGRHLLAVADGLGGHAAGEVASTTVITALAPLDRQEPGDELLGRLRRAVRAGNTAIAQLIRQDPSLTGMGTTLTAILFASDRIGVVNIGDSRTYLMRNGVCTQITHDDSLVQTFLDEHRITPEEAMHHPRRSLILRALTGAHDEDPAMSIREVHPGDRYLLCSDGLTDVVSFAVLEETLRMPDVQVCANRLIELALAGGGPDNITVIVADAVDTDPTTPILTAALPPRTPSP